MGRPHGLDGAFVVERPSDDPGRYAVGRTLWIGGAPATVTLFRRVGGGRLAVKVDRPVERGETIAVRRDDLPRPDADHYYVFQLVGLAVERADGKALGRVSTVDPGVANDILVLDTGLLLPLVDACVRQVDLDAGRIVVEAGFDESD